MSAADSHKQRSRRGYRRQHMTLAPKMSPMVTLSTPRGKKRGGKISSLFFRRPSSG